MREGLDIAIFATGGMVGDALKTAELLALKGIEAKVISMHTVKPIDIKSILECKNFVAVFTMEENSIIGGFGASIAETMMTFDIRPRIFRIFGFPDRFPMISGSRNYLNAHFGLNPESMTNTIISAVKK
jgi:transketolase